MNSDKPKTMSSPKASSSNCQKKPKSAATIYPMQRAKLSIEKTDTIRRLAHEPVKGAVGPIAVLTPVPAVARGTVSGSSESSTQSRRSSSDKDSTSKLLLFQSEGSIDSTRKTSTVIETSESKDSTQQAEYLSDTKQTRRSTDRQSFSNLAVIESVQSRNKQGPPSDPVSSFSNLKIDDNSTSSHAVVVNRIVSSLVASKTAEESATKSSFQPAADSKALDKRCDVIVKKSDDLCAEVRSLKEQLEVQSKVNADLKKLLVASIGDDLHYKVDALVRTKVQLANEIGDYTRKLVEDYEDLDKITIQADLWHSKYQACRVLTEQLTAEKERLVYMCSQSQGALQAILNERQIINDMLRHLNKSLQWLHGTFAPTPAAVQARNPCDGDNMSLVKNSNWLMDGICFTLLGGRPPRASHSTQSFNLTQAEQRAYQVMSVCDKNLHSNASVSHVDVGLTVAQFHAFPRFHPGARYDGFTFMCCTKCKGDVLVV